MATQFELDKCYLNVALNFAKLSKADRKKVGACLVTSHGVILGGCNGTPPNTSNVCEVSNITLPTVVHAELNCILKAAKEGISVVDSTMYLTLSPCESCAAMLISAGVKRIVYLEQYRDLSGVRYLYDNGILVEEFYGDLK